MELASRAPAVLLATVKDVPPGADRGFTVVDSGHEALVLWEQRRHATVYADFGALADGLTGVRLARSIRRRCARTRVLLLADSPRADQAQWAAAQGATGVIARKDLPLPGASGRSSPALAERVAVAPAGSGFASSRSSGFAATDSPEVVVALVTRRLNEAGLGPAASLAVDDAVRTLLRGNGGLPFAAAELARLVAPEISDLPARRRFLDQFAGK